MLPATPITRRWILDPDWVEGTGVGAYICTTVIRVFGEVTFDDATAESELGWVGQSSTGYLTAAEGHRAVTSSEFWELVRVRDESRDVLRVSTRVFRGAQVEISLHHFEAILLPDGPAPRSPVPGCFAPSDRLVQEQVKVIPRLGFWLGEVRFASPAEAIGFDPEIESFLSRVGAEEVSGDTRYDSVNLARKQVRVWSFGDRVTVKLPGSIGERGSSRGVVVSPTRTLSPVVLTQRGLRIQPSPEEMRPGWGAGFEP